MNDTEKFLFDLQGFLKVSNVLSSTEVQALNDAFDANWDERYEDPNHAPHGSTHGPVRRGIFTGMLSGMRRTVSPFATSWCTRSSFPI